jgi:hypothetical protein
VRIKSECTAKCCTEESGNVISAGTVATEVLLFNSSLASVVIVALLALQCVSPDNTTLTLYTAALDGADGCYH